MTWLGRTTAVVLVLAAGVLALGRHGDDANAGYHATGGYRSPTAVSPAQQQRDYLHRVNVVCYDAMATYPTAQAKNDKALMQQQDKVAELWFGMLQAWAAVPAPEGVRAEVSAILEAQNDAYAAFVSGKSTWRQGQERGWTPELNARYQAARDEFNRRIATSVQRTEAFGLSYCARTWWNWT
ncbi:hypothetical protein [Dactylosporangium aurantiacum]|uniref:hypothetical protein n=1 Tax=Dactylosporangium aurantiacum TaxID=35754 RepID=UPI0012DCCF6D|nr:hypothetical protein [Dactylosporangium aurantiacum]MDG6106586.1 hypothetical protein [Dactylosporangium aurantiacum]